MVERARYTNLEPTDLAWAMDNYQLVQVKEDGIFIEVHIKPGSVVGFTRNGRERFRFDHGVPGVSSAVLHCEHISGTQRSTNHRHRRRLVIFDCLEYEAAPEAIGENDTGGPCLRGLCYEARMSFAASLDRVGPFLLAKRWHPHAAPALWGRTMAGEIEGLVFRKDEPFNAPGSLARMKSTVDQEFVCMGFELDPADPGRARSIIGGLVAGGVVQEAVRVGSGITEEDRTAYAQSGQKLIGTQFTAKGNGAFRSGALRHPRFVRWRPELENMGGRW